MTFQIENLGKGLPFPPLRDSCAHRTRREAKAGA